MGNSTDTGSSIHIASDLSVGAEEKTGKRKSEKPPGSLKIVFLSRISPMKNLEYALKVVGRMCGKVVFDILGQSTTKRTPIRERFRAQRGMNKNWIRS